MKNPYKEKEQAPNFSLLKPYEGGKGLKYKEICEILGVEQKKDTRAKERERLRWSGYMDFEYKNTHFYIKEIYPDGATIEFADRFTDAVYMWLLKEFIEIKKNSTDPLIRISKRQLATQTGAISKRLLDCLEDYKKIRTDVNMLLYEKEQIDSDIYYYVRGQAKAFAVTAKHIIENAIVYSLEKMRKRGVILYTEAFVIKYVAGHKVIDGKNDKIEVPQYEYYEVPLESVEANLVVEARDETMRNEKFNFTNLRDIHFAPPEKKTQFYRCLCDTVQKLLNIDTTIEAVYTQYAITTTENTLRRNYLDMVNEVSNKEITFKVNSAAKDKVTNSKNKNLACMPVKKFADFFFNESTGLQKY